MPCWAQLRRQPRRIGGVRRPGIVHRLDKGHQRLMVVAKTDAAHRALSRRFRGRGESPAPMRAVWGVPFSRERRDRRQYRPQTPNNRKKMAVVGGPHGKPALTRLSRSQRKILPARLPYSNAACHRPHPQIRVHLAERGHPVIGDPAYGKSQRPDWVARSGELGARIATFPRQALHARLLGFVHPKPAKTLSFDSAPPPISGSCYPI